MSMVYLSNFGLVDLDNLDEEDIDTVSIAQALSRLYRFSGNFKSMSVAQHCILVSRVVQAMGGTNMEQFAALHHDDSEAFLGDIPSPIKDRCPGYMDIEDEIMDVIDSKYRCETRGELVQRADRIVGARELHHHMDCMPLLSRITIKLPEDYRRYQIGQTMLTPWSESTVLAKYMERNDDLCLAIVEEQPKQLETSKPEPELN